jgi:hypothetical protein
LPGVAEARVDPAPAIYFANPFHGAELEPGEAPGFARAHPCGYMLLDLKLDVRLQFLFEFAFSGCALHVRAKRCRKLYQRISGHFEYSSNGCGETRPLIRFEFRPFLARSRESVKAARRPSSDTPHSALMYP